MSAKAKAEPARGTGNPHVIDPRGLYFPGDVVEVFRLRNSTIRREVREGRLKVAKRAGRYFMLGEWLIEWLRGGVVERRPSPRGSNEN